MVSSPARRQDDSDHDDSDTEDAFGPQGTLGASEDTGQVRKNLMEEFD